ncbi:hypothetical protein [Nocardia sp. NPDC056100]|uniref:hypothetical protein n=1 Tax=Nocardia sp. NPDC056100 TaxID=3345712 RepID=UPI0035E0F200
MTRGRLFRIARITGHLGWWTFVVAVLLGTAMSAAADIPIGRKECSPGDSVLRVCLSVTESAGPPGAGAMAGYATVALGVVVVAAIIEAVVVGERVAGVVTVTVPIVAAALMIKVLNGTGWWSDSSGSVRTVAIVVAAIAAREVWAFGFAPGIPQPNLTPPDRIG